MNIFRRDAFSWKICFSTISALAIFVAGCDRTPLRPSRQIEVASASSSSVAIIAPTKVLIDYPAPGQPDPLNLRGCALDTSYSSLPCHLIGTRGPVKKIAWFDDNGGTPAATLEFDRSGELQRICRRGHVDFQGEHCSTQPFRSSIDAETRLDQRGRILQRRRFSFEDPRRDTCNYFDQMDGSRSECKDGDWTVTYAFDRNGRALSYGRYRYTNSEEIGGDHNGLERTDILELKYVYDNDEYGNWVRFDVVGNKSDGKSRELFDTRTVTLEYYR